MAFNLAKDNILGGGFECFRLPSFARYAPIWDDVHDAHSIYFEVMGEHGFIGLALFLSLGATALLSAKRIAKEAKQWNETRWMADLAAMIQVSLLGYAACGAFLGLAYFDLYYHLIAILVILKVLLKKHKENIGVVDAKVREVSSTGALK